MVRLWLERIGIGLIAVIALGAPLALGLFYYLAVVEHGLSINEGSPQSEARIWIVRERRDLTGIGLQTSARADSADSGQPAQCARQTVTFLKWDGRLRIEPPVSYCACYERRGNDWIQLKTQCRTQT